MRRLLVTHCSQLTRSETFIKAHIERLPFETHFAQDLPPTVVDLSKHTPGEGKPVDALEDHSEVYLQILDRVQPDVVLAEYGPSGVAIQSACEQRHVPLVTHFHGFDISMEKVLTRYAEAYQKLFAYSSAIIGVSNEMVEKLVGLGAEQDKLACVRCGIDTERFSPHGQESTNSIFFVGRLVEKKAPLQCIEAFASAQKEIPELTFKIAGDGPLKEHCLQLIEERGLAHKIELLGHVEHSQVIALLQRSSAFLLPSVTAQSGDQEGLPVSLLEALACGIPVIATRHSGIPEAVIHHQTGLLVEENDVAGIANAIIRLHQDRELEQKLRQGARKHIEQNFSLEQSINELALILNQAIEQ